VFVVDKFFRLIQFLELKPEHALEEYLIVALLAKVRLTMDVTNAQAYFC
jgi:hypothetical protein